MAMVDRKEMTPVKTKNWASEEKSPGGSITMEVEPQVTFTASFWPSLQQQNVVVLSKPLNFFFSLYLLQDTRKLANNNLGLINP